MAERIKGQYYNQDQQQPVTSYMPRDPAASAGDLLVAKLDELKDQYDMAAMSDENNMEMPGRESDGASVPATTTDIIVQQ